MSIEDFDVGTCVDLYVPYFLYALSEQGFSELFFPNKDVFIMLLVDTKKRRKVVSRLIICSMRATQMLLTGYNELKDGEYKHCYSCCQSIATYLKIFTKNV